MIISDARRIIFRAACVRNVDIVRLLFNTFDCASDFIGELGIACYHKRGDIVKFLIKNGATVCSNCGKSMDEHIKRYS